MEEPSPSRQNDADSKDQAEESLSTSKLAQDAAAEFIGLERRLPRTLALVLTRPGMLTLEHRKGQGEKYVSPVRLYILASTVYFATTFAVAPRGLNLGLFTFIPGTSELPSVAPAVILVLAVPLFAALLDGLFYRYKVPFGEFLTSALYFQSSLLLVLIVVALLPIPDPADDYVKLGYFVGYVWLGARRLWPGNVLVDLLRSASSLFLYAFAVFLVVLAVTLFQQWIT